MQTTAAASRHGRIGAVLPMRRASLTEAPWLTTSGAARVLQLSTEGVRALVRATELACQWTESGQRIFDRKEVHRCAKARGNARARSPRQLLAEVRPRMLQACLEPRQARLRVVGEAKGHLRMLK